MSDLGAVLVRRHGRQPRVLRYFTAEQGDKARLLIADGAFAPTWNRRVWRFVSSDGSRTYLASPEACTCPAGKHDRRCYHCAAAGLLRAAGYGAPAGTGLPPDPHRRLAANTYARHMYQARQLEAAGRTREAAKFRELARASSELARRMAATSYPEITEGTTMRVRHHHGFGHGLAPGTGWDMNCPSCIREDA
jgi:hypothetical protein